LKSCKFYNEAMEIDCLLIWRGSIGIRMSQWKIPMPYMHAWVQHIEERVHWAWYTFYSIMHLYACTKSTWTHYHTRTRLAVSVVKLLFLQFLFYPSCVEVFVQHTVLFQIYTYLLSSMNPIIETRGPLRYGP